MIRKWKPQSGTNDFSHYFIHELCQLCLKQEQNTIDILVYFSQKLPLIPNVLIRNISYAGIRYYSLYILSQKRATSKTIIKKL